MKNSRITLSLATALSLAACGQSGPVADNAANVEGLPSADQVAGANDGRPSADGSVPVNVPTVPATNAKPSPAAAIPAAFHGRWGLTPADCTSTAGDAKGLLSVASDGMTFFESRATPAGNVKSAPDSFSADFAFTGEGQSWTRYQTLLIQGEKLVRTESSPMASFTYARCG
jgi:predicted small lipoprotein YifL